MKTRNIVLLLVTAVFAIVCSFALLGQDIKDTIRKGDLPVIAVADMHGSGAAEQYMDAFNKTLWDELAYSGQIKLAPKTSYPLQLPQQASDFKPPVMFSDWTRPPVSANYLAFGYTAVQDDQILLFGNFYNVGQPTVQTAQVIANRYYGALSNDGARKVAREFAADILKQLGIATLSGTRIYFVSDRTGNTEIWSMDYDGSNQRQLTNYKTSSREPAVSADGKLFAFRTLTSGPSWNIRIHTTDTIRNQNFFNPVSSLISDSGVHPGRQAHLVFGNRR